MPAPATPSLSAAVTSTTSFTASVNETAGVAVSLYGRRLGDPAALFAPLGTGTGICSIPVAGQVDSAAYLLYAVGGDAANGYSLPATLTVSLASPDGVLESVLAKWNASAALTALVPPGLWNGEVPENTDLPYAFAVLEGTRFGHQTEFDNVEVARVCLYCYTAGAALASRVAAEVQQEFDWCTDLAFTNGNLVQCMKRGYRLTPALARWKDGTAIYSSEVSYEIWVARTSPH